MDWLDFLEDVGIKAKDAVLDVVKEKTVDANANPWTGQPSGNVSTPAPAKPKANEGWLWIAAAAGVLWYLNRRK